MIKQIDSTEWVELLYSYTDKFLSINEFPAIRRREIILLAALNTSKQEEKAYNYILELKHSVLQKCSDEYVYEYYTK